MTDGSQSKLESYGVVSPPLTSFDKQFAVSKAFNPEVVKLIRYKILPQITEIRISSSNEDYFNALDLQVISPQSDWGVRIRKIHYLFDFKDVAFRGRKLNSYESFDTEYAKLKRRFLNFYFYGWADNVHEIPYWICLDLHLLRKSGLLERSYSIRGDGTVMHCIRLRDLYNSCIVASSENFLRWADKSLK